VENSLSQTSFTRIAWYEPRFILLGCARPNTGRGPTSRIFRCLGRAFSRSPFIIVRYRSEGASWDSWHQVMTAGRACQRLKDVCDSARRVCARDVHATLRSASRNAHWHVRIRGTIVWGSGLFCWTERGSRHVTCMYPPPHMTCMYPKPHMTCMYPPPHMTCMYLPPETHMYPPPHMACWTARSRHVTCGRESCPKIQPLSRGVD
jgi:hypothetical protein